MKKLDQEPWMWSLWEDGDRLVLRVMSGGSKDFSAAFELTASERKAWEDEGHEGMAKMADTIREDWKAHASRHILFNPYGKP